MRLNQAKRHHLIQCVEMLHAEPRLGCHLAGRGWRGFFHSGAPVQGDGSIHGRPFYFHARWDTWRVDIDGVEVAAGTFPNASWMPRMDVQKIMSHVAERVRH